MLGSRCYGKYLTILKIVAKNKHSSLFFGSIGEKEKNPNNKNCHYYNMLSLYRRFGYWQVFSG